MLLSCASLERYRQIHILAGEQGPKCQALRCPSLRGPTLSRRKVERPGNRPYAYNPYDDVGPNMFPLPSASGPGRSCGTRTTPTRSGGSCRRTAGTLSEASGQRAGELLVAHGGGPAPEVIHQPELLPRKVVTVPRERAFESSPRLLEKPGVRRSPSCQVPQYFLAQRSLLSTTTMVE